MALSANLKKYLSNTSWLFLEKILRMVVGFTVGVWTARYLGPEQFGLFSYAQSFVFLFTAFATLGLDGIVIRELVKDPSRRDSLLGTSFVLKLIGSIIVMMFLGLSLVLMHTDKTTALIMILVASATIFQSFNVIDFYFQSKVLSKYVVFASIISMLVVNGIKIWLIITKADLIWFAAAIAIEAVIVAAGLIVYYLKSGMTLKDWKFLPAVAKNLLKDSWPLILSGVMISLYMRIDQIMIQSMLGYEAVGQYAAATRLSEMWYFIPMIISSSLFPAILDAKQRSEEEYLRKLQNLYSLVIWIAIAIALPMTFLSDWIVQFLYGNEFAQAAAVLKIHVWAGVFLFLTVTSGQWLITENYTRIAFTRNFFGAIANIALNIYLLNIVGITGAAFATCISWMISGFIYDIFARKTRYMFFIKLGSFNPSRIRSK